MESSRDGGGELGEQVAGETVMKSPGDCDRTLALVRDVGRRAEAPERSIRRTESREEHHVRFLFGLADVAPSCVAVERCRGLALPVDELGADCVVAIPGGGRERAGGLVEREREQVTLAALVPPDA